MKVRIKFTKRDNMKFVGHLDIMRYFQKAMRRADIDIAYSEGFSPHQIMSFAAPLGVGLTSEGEYMDIELGLCLSSADIVKRLNAVMVEGMEIINVRKLSDDNKNAMSIVSAADYSATFREGHEVKEFDIGFQLEEFYHQEHIMIIKKTKKSEREIDIKPLIYKLKYKDQAFFMQLATGSADHIKPELVIEAFYCYLGISYNPVSVMIKRLEVYGTVGDGDMIRFIPLEEFGDQIEEKAGEI